MSKYNEYAKKLKTEFCKAASITAEQISYYKEAEREDSLANAMGSYDERYIGEAAARKAVSSARLTEAKTRSTAAISSAWHEYRAAVEMLTAKLRKTINDDNVANPDAVDENAVMLINNNIVNVDDLESWIEKYDSNPTMLRVIGAYARDKAENENNENIRGRLFVLSEKAREGKSEQLRNWDSLVSAADTMTGLKHIKGNVHPSDYSYISRMNDLFGDSLADTIDNF